MPLREQTGRDNAASFNPSTVESILKSFYMDDFLKSVISEEQAKDLCKEMIDIMKKGGFNLTKFKSNSINVLKALPEDKCQITVQQLEIDGDQIERTLGVHWRINEDYFTFTRNMKDYSTTKRGILSAVSSVFDPLGFLTPFTLKAKLIIQEMWRQNLDWDEEVPIDILKVWKRWLEGTKDITEITIDRCYHLYGWQCSNIQLHIFCDASEVAYGAVGYLQFAFKDGTVYCCFVMGKSRLAPIKTLTMPRLELNAAVTGVKLYNLIKLIYKSIFPLKRSNFGQIQHWLCNTSRISHIVLKYM